MPAKAIWHSDSCPLMPVMSVTDRQMIDAHKPKENPVTYVVGTHVTLEARNATTRTQNPTRVGTSSRRSRIETAGGAGGGSHAARGSELSSSRRRPGLNSKVPTSTTKGKAGTSVWASHPPDGR